MSAELPWRYRIVPACWEWVRFDAGWTGGSLRGLRMLIRWQCGRCAVCGATYDDELRVDRDRDAQQVRGLLCASCLGAESRSEAKVFRSYRRLHPAMLLGVSISSQVLGTGFWRRWERQLLRTPAHGADPASPEGKQHDPAGKRGSAGQRGVLGRFGRRRRGQRVQLDPSRPDRFRLSLERDAPDAEQTDRLRIALHQALEDVEQYASSSRSFWNTR